MWMPCLHGQTHIYRTGQQVCAKSDANMVSSAICKYLPAPPISDRGSHTALSGSEQSFAVASLLAARKLQSSGMTRRTYTIGTAENFGMEKSGPP